MLNRDQRDHSNGKEVVRTRVMVQTQNVNDKKKEEGITEKVINTLNPRLKDIYSSFPVEEFIQKELVGYFFWYMVNEREVRRKEKYL